MTKKISQQWKLLFELPWMYAALCNIKTIYNDFIKNWRHSGWIESIVASETQPEHQLNLMKPHMEQRLLIHIFLLFLAEHLNIFQPYFIHYRKTARAGLIEILMSWFPFQYRQKWHLTSLWDANFLTWNCEKINVHPLQTFILAEIHVWNWLKLEFRNN